MPFLPPQLIIESILKDGILDMQNNPDVLDDVFAELNSNYASRKYGASEIQKIKDLITGADNTEIAIVFSFFEAEAKTPCYSLQLAHHGEDVNLARLNDFEEDLCEPLTPAELTPLIKETGIIPTSYDPLTGRVAVPDSVDLSNIFKNFAYEDGSTVDHIIQSGISDVIGSKFFFIPKQASPDILNPGLIKSFLTQKALEIRGVTDDVAILIGVHAKEPLLVIYLHMLLQFFLLSRKSDMIRRGFFVSTLSGSDFTRDLAYRGDAVFTRFLTISGKIENTWRSDSVVLVDSVNIEGTPTE